MSERTIRRLGLGGWLLFVVSAIFFTLSALRSGDLLGLLGALVFLIACFVFLVPYLAPGSGEEG